MINQSVVTSNGAFSSFMAHLWTEAFSNLVNDALSPVWRSHQKSTTLEAKFIVTYEK